MHCIVLCLSWAICRSILSGFPAEKWRRIDAHVTVGSSQSSRSDVANAVKRNLVSRDFIRIIDKLVLQARAARAALQTSTRRRTGLRVTTYWPKIITVTTYSYDIPHLRNTRSSAVTQTFSCTAHIAYLGLLRKRDSWTELVRIEVSDESANDRRSAASSAGYPTAHNKAHIPHQQQQRVLRCHDDQWSNKSIGDDVVWRLNNQQLQQQ